MTVTMPWRAPEDTPINGAAEHLDELRRAVADEIDKAPETIAAITSDSAAGLSRFLDQLVRLIEGLAPAIAAAVTRASRDVADNADVITGNLRLRDDDAGSDSVGKLVLNIGAFVGGMTAGAALMWFFDPDSGLKRRRAARQAITSRTRKASEELTPEP